MKSTLAEIATSPVAHRWFVKRSYSPRHLHSTFVRHIVHLLFFLLSLALFFFHTISYLKEPRVVNWWEGFEEEEKKFIYYFIVHTSLGKFEILFWISQTIKKERVRAKHFIYYDLLLFVRVVVNKHYIKIIYSKKKKKENKFIHRVIVQWSRIWNHCRYKTFVLKIVETVSL